MNKLSLTELCKVDGKMSNSFMEKVTSENFSVYCVCEYTGMEIYLDEPEYRNGVKYLVKRNA